MIATVDRPVQTIDATGCLVMPGLIDVHMHSAATVARGLAQEVDAWMGSAYGPMVRHIADDDAPLFSALALMEGVSNGTTTFGDYEAPMMEIAAIHEAMGNRAVLCQGITEIDWSQRETWMEQGWKPGDPAFLDPAIGEVEFQKELAVYDRWNGTDEGRITNLLGPIAADMVSKELLLRAKEEARRRGTRIHLHVAQDPRENNATMQRYGMRAIPFLDSIGVLDAGTIATHLCSAEPEKSSWSRVVGRPWPAARIRSARSMASYRRRRSFHRSVELSGLAPIRPRATTRTISSRRCARRPCSPRSQQAVHCRCRRGRCCAWPRSAARRSWASMTEVGTLEVGKEADLIMIDLTKPPMAPVVLHPARNIAANLVYAETGSNVRMTMVAGRVIYRDGVFTRIDERRSCAMRRPRHSLRGTTALRSGHRDFLSPN